MGKQQKNFYKKNCRGGGGDSGSIEVVLIDRLIDAIMDPNLKIARL